jgi:hypothetical protein
VGGADFKSLLFPQLDKATNAKMRLEEISIDLFNDVFIGLPQ